MRSAGMPMEVLGLDIERDGVGEQRIERGGHLADGLFGEIGWGFQNSGGLMRLKLSDLVAAHGSTSCAGGDVEINAAPRGGAFISGQRRPRGGSSCGSFSLCRPLIRIRNIMEYPLQCAILR